MEQIKIKVDISEAYRYMGCSGNISTDIEKDLILAANTIEEIAVSRYVMKICDIDRADGIALKGTNLRFEGKSVAALLHDCELCAILCATVGSDFDALIRKWQLKDIAFASMLDACASSAVESVCNGAEELIKNKYSAEGYYLTDRFSPGYGDLPLSTQTNFCLTLDTARKIGVTVGANLMMTPSKSVTALIGLSKNQQKHIANGCNGCKLIKSCKFRENGVTCYGQVIK